MIHRYDGYERGRPLSSSSSSPCLLGWTVDSYYLVTKYIKSLIGLSSLLWISSFFLFFFFFPYLFIARRWVWLDTSPTWFRLASRKLHDFYSHQLIKTSGWQRFDWNRKQLALFPFDLFACANVAGKRSFELSPRLIGNCLPLTESRESHLYHIFSLPLLLSLYYFILDGGGGKWKKKEWKEEGRGGEQIGKMGSAELGGEPSKQIRTTLQCHGHRKPLRVLYENDDFYWFVESYSEAFIALYWLLDRFEVEGGEGG